MLAAAGVLAQVCYPLTTGAARDRLSVVAVLALAAACLVHCVLTRGPRTALSVLVLTGGVGFAAELVGTRTGVPFGTYSYAPGRLGPTLAGVPLVVAGAWFLGAWTAWCAAGLVARRGWPRTALAATGLATWDLFLDPQMVADGRWVFAHPSPGLPGLDGVPLTNYAGWAVVSVVLCVGLARLDRRHAADGRGGAGLEVPVALYLWTWLGSALAHGAFLGLPASGAWGALGMGVLGVPVLAALRGTRRAGRATGRG